MLKLFTVALACYSVLLLLVFFWQRKLLYIPDQDPVTVAAAHADGLQHWPDHPHFRGFIAQQQHDQPSGTVIVFHGNAGGAHQRAFYHDALAPLGLRVILAEYPGYGGRSGSPSEALLVADALTTVRTAQQQFGGPIYLWGESLGCGVVSAVVERMTANATAPVIAGVVLLLPWDRLHNVAQAHYPLLPVRWLLRDHYDNVANLKHYRGKVAVLVAEHDEVIAAGYGKRLYHSLRSPAKRLWVFAHGTHNNLPITPDRPWWREVVAFISSTDATAEVTASTTPWQDVRTR